MLERTPENLAATMERAAAAPVTDAELDAVIAQAAAKVHEMDDETPEAWQEFISAKNSGATVEIDSGIFWYFLEVLPPVWMGKVVEIDGSPRRCSFGFAEGCEAVTAFWKTGSDDAARYFCKRTEELNSGF